MYDETKTFFQGEAMKTKILVLMVCLGLISTTFSCLVLAEEQAPAVSSHCIGSQDFHKAVSQLTPWFGLCEQRIRRTRLWTKKHELCGNKFACSFGLRTNGEITDIHLVHSSGDHAIDRSALDLIETLSPLPPPPNDLPLHRGVLVRFGTDPDIQVQLNSIRLGRGEAKQ